MSQPKIIAYSRVMPEVLDSLKRSYEVVHYEHDEHLENENFAADITEAEGVIGLGLKVTPELLDRAENLKVISNVSAGYDNMNVEAMTIRGVMGTNTPGVLDETTADAVFGLILAAARRIPELDRYVKEKQWTELLPEEKFGLNVNGKTLGIIGLGRIGSEIAKRGRYGFDMNILYHARSRKEDAERDFEAQYCELDDLLARADFIVAMTPLTEETRKMIGREQFQQMKETAIFINASRGGVIEEEALVSALENGEIWSAGLDVYSEEPLPFDHPFLKLENIVTTPHIGSATRETEEALSARGEQNLREALEGRRPQDLINPEAYES
ncbi:gluconate 2-dehydrogenase [Salsuginibacillus halophilus]|uniref:Gluconate 2-dehydrogenase n=1 Tax=Salsuginibacillus halophilus TaxID=517424 RepID=A0A2P8H953_9BACI|nr:D-glycerate dehydrogenase [Salsuginibacillus halophilus]PSL42721.1 gluconate 2-dehydrogenase [Salsuginibacillus halophilus]